MSEAVEPLGADVAPHDAYELELALEQAHVDRAYERLDEVKGQARSMARRAFNEDPGGGHAARLDRETLVAQAARRVGELEIGSAPLVFGRLDPTEDDPLHVGRVAVSDVDHEPLVVDWRAPAAAAFYRATAADPMGVTRRRHLICRDRRVAALEDELLERADAASGLTLVGEGALLAALDQERTGRMSDIVATLQAEQDRIVRSPLPGVRIVQGGPGTGKTAVALHRVAYLLYEHRGLLDDQGVLVIGPSPLFLRYVERVLPSLGEHGVTMATLADMVPEVDRVGHEAAPIARVKGDGRMAELLKRAVRDRQRPLRDPISIPYGAHRLVVTTAVTRRIVNRMRRGRGAHNPKRRHVRDLVAEHLVEQWAEATGHQGDVPETLRHHLVDSVRSTAEWRELMERVWPLLRPTELLRDLFGSPALLRSAGQPSFSATELEHLHRGRVPVAEVAWTDADLPLLDEARRLLGDPPRRRADDDDGGADDGLVDRVLADMDVDPGMRRALADRLRQTGRSRSVLEMPPVHDRTFAHVVVDEAQELTPMAWRMLARRNPRGSMTVVGDLGQAVGPFTPVQWEDLAEHLPGRKAPEVSELTINYRTPAEITDLAARVLDLAAPGLVPPRSVRHAGFDPELVEGSVPGAVLRAADELAAEIAPGTVAIICPTELTGQVSAASGLAVDPDDLLDRPIVLLTPQAAKGLEFDGVVVVEPARLAAQGGPGLRSLYVAMTRATKRLSIVHAEPLPEVLR